MKQLICPIGKKPCDRDCPDRYPDQPEGGCRLTTAQELARCKYPEKVFNALTALLSEEPEILREEAEV